MSASFSFPIPIWALVVPLIQLGLLLCSSFAAILFFKADRRMHTWMLLIGSMGGALSALVSMTEVISANFISYYSSYHSDPADSHLYHSYAVIAGLDLIFGGMVAYGLVAVALIQ